MSEALLAQRRIAEESLLGALLRRDTDTSRVIDLVEPRHLIDPFHRRLYTAVRKVIEKSKPVKIQSILAEMEGGVRDGDGAGIAVLAQKADAGISAIDFVDPILSGWQLAELANLHKKHGEQIAAATNWESATELIQNQAAEIAKILESGATRNDVKTISMAEAAKSAVDTVAIAYQNEGRLVGITSGLRSLDKKTNGFQRGKLIIVGARPSAGKSALAISFATAASAAGHGVHFSSLEMTAEEIATRAISANTATDGPGIPYFLMSRGSFDERGFERIASSAKRISSAAPIYIDERSGVSVEQIKSAARETANKLETQGRTLDLLIVDYLQLVRASSRYKGERHLEVGEVSLHLVELAKQMNVCIVALAQLSRAVDAREDKRPRMSDLKEAGGIEENAHVVMLLYREEYYLRNREPKTGTDEWFKWEKELSDNKNKLEIIMEKHRGGPTGIVPVFYDPALNLVADMSAE